MVPQRLEFNVDESEESEDESGPTPSTSAPSGKSGLKRGQHGRHKVHNVVHAITKIGSHGEPLEPTSVIGVYSNQVTCLAKEIVPITYLDWRKVPNNLKKKVWKGVKLRFRFPANTYDEKLCQKHAMTIASKGLRSFRGHLYKDYVLQGRSPLVDYTNIKSHT